MSILPALALAGALTYVAHDFVGGLIPVKPLVWVVDVLVFYAVYQLTRRWLESLKE